MKIDMMENRKQSVGAMQQHYHFVGIGGIGMGALASLLLSRGEAVSGSDAKDGPMIHALVQRGAVVHLGHDAGHVGQADKVVYSSAIKDNNPELLSARAAGIPLMKRAELLAELMDGATGITVAGAHGKTTTSSMIAHMMLTAGLKPTVAVGGVIRGLDVNAVLGSGRYFVAELDESDGSFLLFHPKISVVTNIDFEHVDYYKTWANILQAYQRFLDQTQPDGTVIACGEDPRLMALLKNSGRKVLSYGFQPQQDLSAAGIKVRMSEKPQTVFSVLQNGRFLTEMTLPALGDHNVLNALACLGVGIALGLDVQDAVRALGVFPGVNRRLQLKGRAAGIAVYDDYGHHPTEIRAVLNAARLLAGKRLITVFQPHRYSRTRFLLEEFIQALTQTDVLFITDIYAASEEPLAGISGEGLVERIREAGKETVYYVPRGRIVQELSAILEVGDMVLTLGAGDIYKIGETLLASLPTVADL
ncbi:MAG TPA: UDP-N-acetylmuramate--L-alanine ligase [Candidatus Omnitrophota bacterium]|nr:UDP-N-acetylmuramate--L-alanine ligase [Candidatus Omnitrophota bacterium]